MTNDEIKIPKDDLMTSVITWTRYDGSPETLPGEGSGVIVSDCIGKPFYAVKRGNLWFVPTHRFKGPTSTYRLLEIHSFDRWAYLPKSPEAEE